jgi:hypothetical protein
MTRRALSRRRLDYAEPGLPGAPRGARGDERVAFRDESVVRGAGMSKL